MAYDIVRESVALIEAGCADPVRSLTRRRRFAAMAVDVSGGLAVTMFARRGVGCVHQETQLLALRDGEWTWLAGGGISTDQRVLADRPAVLPRSPLLGPNAPVSSNPRIIIGSGAGRVPDDRGQEKLADGRRWVSYSVMRVSARVASVEVFDRILKVPWHGYVPVVWCGDPPDAKAHDATGRKLAELRPA